MDSLLQKAREGIARITRRKSTAHTNANPAGSGGGVGAGGGPTGIPSSSDVLSEDRLSVGSGGSGCWDDAEVQQRRSPSACSNASNTNDGQRQQQQSSSSHAGAPSGLTLNDPAIAYQGQSPGAGDKDSKLRRKKDNTIFVHPLLDKEFDDNITPPRSPTSNRGGGGAGGHRTSPSTNVVARGGGHLMQPSSHNGSLIRSLPSSPPAQRQFAQSRSDGSNNASSEFYPSSSQPSSRMNNSGNNLSHNNNLVRTAQLKDILCADPVDMKRLRSHCWGGCSNEQRHEAWALLTGYHTAQHGPRGDVVRRKRAEYGAFLRRTYDNVNWDHILSERASQSSLTTSLDAATVGQEEITIMKQIRKDVPRTSGGIHFLQHPRVMLTLERVLYTWALRHPACGYVQGMNDIVLPFLYVSLAARFLPTSKSATHLAECSEQVVEELFSLDQCSHASWLELEADLYWMCSTLLNGLQENFTYDQAGVHAMVRTLEAIARASQPALMQHLDDIGVMCPQFAFRWMNCLLIREFTMPQVLRLWDTYLAEENGDIGSLHVFVCASLLARWAPTLMAANDFSAAMMFLQNPSTTAYRDRDMDELISEGYLKQQLYANSNAVLRTAKN